jgi:hypothetical protein
MCGKDEESWVQYKLPILMALSVLQRPVFIDEIADLSGVQQRAYIRAILHDWAPYLHEELVEHQGELQKCYSLYHRSFYYFIINKEEIKDERESRKEALKKFL